MSYSSNRWPHPGNVSLAKLILLPLVVGLTLLAPSCSPKKAQDKPPEPLTVAAVLDHETEVVNKIPQHPRSEEVLAKLKEAMAKEDLPQGISVEYSLMLKCPNNNVGLYLFDEADKQAASRSEQEAIALEERIGREASGSAIALAAFGKGLERVRRANPDEFLRRCDSAIGEKNNTTSRVALYMRACSYRDHGELKKAALDFIRFWSLFPDKVKSADLIELAVGTTRQAGFRLEAQLLETASDPAPIAAFLTSTFQSVPEAELQPSFEGASNGLSAYLRLSPDAEAIERAMATHPPQQAATRLEEALYWARTASLHIENRNTAKVAEAYATLAKTLRDLLEEDTERNREGLSLLTACYACGRDNVWNLFRPRNSERELVRSEGDSRPPSADKELYLALADGALALYELRARADGDSASAAFLKDVESYVADVMRVDDRERSVRAYEHFVTAYPASVEAPQALIALASFAETKQEAPARACDYYTQVIEKYPAAKESLDAAAKKSVLMYKQGKYPETYELCQVFIAEHPEASQVVAVKFLASLCEASLGSAEAAETHMAAIVTDYPQNPLAAKAMYWLGSQKLAQQAYRAAKQTFTDLVQRYPDSKEALSAKEYIERLGKLDEQKGS